MFTNRKERAELLEGLVVSNKDATVPVLHQVPLLTLPYTNGFPSCVLNLVRRYAMLFPQNTRAERLGFH